MVMVLEHLQREQASLLNLRKRLLELKGKKIKATPVGIKLLSELPDLCKNPVLTAMFESQLKLVESGKLHISSLKKSKKLLLYSS